MHRTFTLQLVPGFYLGLVNKPHATSVHLYKARNGDRFWCDWDNVPLCRIKEHWDPHTYLDLARDRLKMLRHWQAEGLSVLCMKNVDKWLTYYA